MLDSRGNVAGTEAQGTIAPIHTVDGLSGSSTDFFSISTPCLISFSPLSIPSLHSHTFVANRPQERQSRFGLLDSMIFG